VTVPAGASCRTPVARVHRADLDESECNRLFGIPCTGVARTLVDCSLLVGDKSLASMVDDALCRHLSSVEAIEHAAQLPGRRGIRRLRRVLDPWVGGITPDSPAETRLQRQLEAWGYPQAVRQYPVYDRSGSLVGEMDLAWPWKRVGLEYDSDAWHNPRHWRHDETRHAAVVRMGWVLLHADKVDLRAGERRFRRELERAWTSERAPTAL
jgi:hypothetical protein